MPRGVYLGATPRSIVFWQSPLSQVIRNNTWEPLHFGSLTTTIGDWGQVSGPGTTIAAGSNGAILPQATIFLASVANLDVPFTSAFPEFVVLTIGGKHTVVSYTGINTGANTITGCTGGTGTMTTGDAVAKGNVNWHAPPGSVAAAVAEAAFVANAAGDRGIRYRAIDGVFNFPAGTKTERAANGIHHVQTNEQPASAPSTSPGSTMRVEVFQDSGGVLDSPFVPLAAPRLVAIPIGRSPL